MNTGPDKALRDLVPSAVERPLGPADGKDDSALTRAIRSKTFFVAKGMTFQDLFEFKHMEDYFVDVDDWKHVITDWLGAESVSVNTRDGRRLDALWLETPPASTNAAVALFHANCAIAIDMALWGAWYRQRGMSVLMITMGGYAGSQGETTELSSYFDADAAVHYLMHRGVPKKKILVHGLSIGGALAVQVSAQHSGVSCTLDQTFVNSSEVAESTACMISKHVPGFAINSVVDACFPKGESDPRLPGVVSDAYNNEGKVGKIEGHYFVIWAENDHMMPPAFAERLFRAHYQPMLKEAVKADVSWGTDKVYRCCMVLDIATGQLQDHGLEELCTMLRTKAKEMCSTDDDTNQSLEKLALKLSCRIPGGEHGSFFGDDDTCSMMYETHLRGLGFVRDFFQMQ